MSADGNRREPSPALIRGLWAVVALLVALGVVAAVGRTVFLDDFIARAEPVRLWNMTALGRDDPRALQRPAVVARMDGTFASHPKLTLLHVVPVVLFLLFAPLQFVSRLRVRHPALHRWSGRILLLLLIATALPGLFFGLLMPFGGLGEAVAIALFGVIDAVLTPSGYPVPDQFVLSVWAGWLITLGAAEAWIRYTCPRVRVVLPVEADGHQYRAVGKYPAAG